MGVEPTRGVRDSGVGRRQDAIAGSVRVALVRGGEDDVADIVVRVFDLLNNRVVCDRSGVVIVGAGVLPKHGSAEAVGGHAERTAWIGGFHQTSEVAVLVFGDQPVAEIAAGIDRVFESFAEIDAIVNVFALGDERLACTVAAEGFRNGRPAGGGTEEGALLGADLSSDLAAADLSRRSRKTKTEAENQPKRQTGDTSA